MESKAHVCKLTRDYKFNKYIPVHGMNPLLNNELDGVYIHTSFIRTQIDVYIIHIADVNSGESERVTTALKSTWREHT